jgi:hypothetical protein
MVSSYNPNPSFRQVISHAIVVTENDHNLESLAPKVERQLIDEIQAKAEQYIHDIVFQWFVNEGLI